MKFTGQNVENYLVNELVWRMEIRKPMNVDCVKWEQTTAVDKNARKKANIERTINASSVHLNYFHWKLLKLWLKIW